MPAKKRAAPATAKQARPNKNAVGVVAVNPFAPIVSKMFDRLVAKEKDTYKARWNPEPLPPMTQAEIVGLMNAPLSLPKAIPSGEDAREKLALADLLQAGEDLRQAQIAEANPATMTRLVFSIGEASIEWMAARAAQDDTRAAIHLVELRVASHAVIDRILPASLSGKVAQQVSRRIASQKKRQGSPKGGRKVDFSQDDNRTVIELFGIIEAYRFRWRLIAASDSKRIPKGIDAIPAACIALEDFTPATWPDWHEVGKRILKSEGKGASSHLKEAWQRMSKLPSGMPPTPTYL